MITKRIIFRLHKQENGSEANKIVEFIKGYFNMMSKKIKVSFEKVSSPYDDIPDHDTKSYDIFVETASNETENIAHAAGWSYVVGKQNVLELTKGLYFEASTTFHNNSHLADELAKVKPLYQDL